MRNIKRCSSVKTAIFFQEIAKGQSFVNSKTMIKIAFMVIVSVLGFCILSVNVGITGEYHFVWDPHPNDQVVEFRIYYRANSGLYNKTDFEPVLISNPKYNPTKPDWILVLPDDTEEYCFTVTAVDDNGYESNHSNEIGMGATCGQIVNDGGGNYGGSGGGRCFLLQGILNDRRWDSY